MLRGVRFPSTARFCVTGWGTGCKRSSLLFFFFFFSSLLLFLLETKGEFRLFCFGFFLIKVPIPCRASPAGLAMPLAGDAGGAPVGVSSLEKPFAGTQAGFAGAFYFTWEGQPAHRLALAGAFRHLLKKGLAPIRRSEMRWVLEHLLGSRRAAKRGVRPPGPPMPTASLSLAVAPPSPTTLSRRAEQGGDATSHPNQPVGFFYRHQMFLIEES